MSDSGRTYTRSSEGQSPGLIALKGIEKYVRGLIAEVNSDLKDLDEKIATEQAHAAHHERVRSRLQAKKHAYKDVLQYIKDGKGIL